MWWLEIDASRLPGQACLRPESQEVEVVSGGEPVTITVRLENCGSNILGWEALPDPETGWLSVEPATGSHMPGAETSLTVTIDPADMVRVGRWAGSVLVTGGLVDARSHLDIDVIALPPVAGFEAEPFSGEAPLTVSFTNTSTGTVLESSWDFGDGEVSDSRHPEHTYATAGLYTVSLAVTGSGTTDTLEREDLIAVAEPEVEEAPDASTDTGRPPGTMTDARGCGCALVW
jgi:hypothetical protein